MRSKSLFAVAALFFILLTSLVSPRWGFFGHRRINRMAVFTLPPDLIGLYKKNLEYVTEHAVDPDKRRYATRHEAVRHYIDIDHWDTYPFSKVPRDWTEALMKYTSIHVVNELGDTLVLTPDPLPKKGESENYFSLRRPDGQLAWSISKGHYERFFRNNILNQYYEDDWLVPCDSFRVLLGQYGQGLDCQAVFAKDHFSEYGILPFHLPVMQNRLTTAFRQKNINQILRLSAEIGHYIGDAHVPLHTTENYNGQLTDQLGIHAFWESRLPELYADKTYDFFVGKATYIEDPKSYFWKIVLDSHVLLDSVLQIEKELSQTFPPDQQFCFEERLDATVRTQCPAYCAAYHDRMAGMVEKRMQDAILAIGSAWFTAWVDAGQPAFNLLRASKPSRGELAEMEALEREYNAGAVKGRKHE
ncbi:MAG: zinc dependent phospholipase C family protein [Saprospiraceae bacterium]